MNCRNRLPLTAAAVVFFLAGCAAPRPNRFAMPFAPPPAAHSDVNITAEAPPLAANVFLSGQTPNPIPETYRLAAVPTASDLIISRADEAFQRGKRYYQSGDKERARRQFDRAVDLFFQGSDNPGDRAAFDRRFEETVDAISRYDLAGLGPAQNQEEPGFERAPLEDILEMSLRCKFTNCQHESEPGCAIKSALANGGIQQQRWKNYLKMKKELDLLAKKKSRR